jgi:ubiquinone/menaquinone biosynthesis C-methylase UbiE
VLKQVVQQINVKKTAKLNILDVGCGTGNLLMLLRKEYSYANLYALDFSDDMLNIAKAKRIPNVKYINADLNDVESLDLPYFDVIIASFVFHNFKLEEEHRQAMNVLNKMLSVNGRLIVADLIDPGLSAKRKMHRRKLVKQMRAHNLQNAEIMRWLITLEEEDTPLTVQQNIARFRYVNLCLLYMVLI